MSTKETRVDYTELEREKKLRIDSQLALLEEQTKRLHRERDQLFWEILNRNGLEVTEQDNVNFYNNHVTVKVKKAKSKK